MRSPQHISVLQPFFMHEQPLPHIFMFLQDDLGYDDVAFNGTDPACHT